MGAAASIVNAENETTISSYHAYHRGIQFGGLEAIQEEE